MGKHSTASWLVAEGVMMKQRFTYDCVLIKEDDGYCASFPQIPGAFADGDTREEAIAHASAGPQSLRTTNYRAGQSRQTRC